MTTTKRAARFKLVRGFVGLALLCVCACAPHHEFPPSSTVYSTRPAMSTYTLTQRQAREAVFAYCEMNCEYYAARSRKPSLPYRATFRRALAGDFDALHTVITNENYHSGDNEDWIDIHWAILHAVGDESFASFLLRLNAKERDGLLFYLCYAIYGPSERDLQAYLLTHFPRVARIYDGYQATTASHPFPPTHPSAPVAMHASRWGQVR